MGIHTECIANASKYEPNFRGEQHGYTCVTISDQNYALHCKINFVPTRKPLCTPEYPINTTHNGITVYDKKYQNNLHDYHLVKNMNSAWRKLWPQKFDDQWLKGVKELVTGYENKTFVEPMYWIYINYRQITPGDITKNQYTMHTLYHVK